MSLEFKNEKHSLLQASCSKHNNHILGGAFTKELKKDDISSSAASVLYVLNGCGNLGWRVFTV